MHLLLNLIVFYFLYHNLIYLLLQSLYFLL